MPVPDSIEEYGSGVTLDSSSGGLVSGFSSCASSPNSGVEELQSLLHEAREEGQDRAILILDGTYQFAVSIGVYVPARRNGARRAA